MQPKRPLHNGCCLLLDVVYEHGPFEDTTLKARSHHLAGRAAAPGTLYALDVHVAGAKSAPAPQNLRNEWGGGRVSPEGAGEKRAGASEPVERMRGMPIAPRSQE